MDKEKLKSYPLGDTFIMMDNQIIWGDYDIVDSKLLELSDIHFPIQAGASLDIQDLEYYRLCWGFGMVVKDMNHKLPDALDNSDIMRHSCYIGVSKSYLEHDIKLAANYREGLSALEQQVFQYFNLPLNMTFDEFNQKYGGKTKEEYLVYANQYIRKIK